VLCSHRRLSFGAKTTTFRLRLSTLTPGPTKPPKWDPRPYPRVRLRKYRNREIEEEHTSRKVAPDRGSSLAERELCECASISYPQFALMANINRSPYQDWQAGQRCCQSGSPWRKPPLILLSRVRNIPLTGCTSRVMGTINEMTVVCEQEARDQEEHQLPPVCPTLIQKSFAC
jgi:hypothetical protein